MIVFKPNKHITEFDASQIPPNVEVVDFSYCGKLKTIKNSFPDTIKEIDFSWCRSLEEFPAFPSQIQKINLENCRALKEIKNPLPSELTTLIFSGCLKLERVPPLPSKLTFLNFSGCGSIKEVSSIPRGITVLDFSSCKSLERILDFPDELTVLNFFNCSRLKTLAVFPPKLTSLHLHHFKGKIDRLPPLLTSLIFSGHTCKQLPFTIPAGIKELDFKRCKSLTKLPDFLPEELEKLDLEFCESLTELPNILPKKLTEINLDFCTKLTTLPRSLLHLDNLKLLNLTDCKNLSEENVNLLRELERKHVDAGNTRFRIIWPDHFATKKLSLNHEMLEEAYRELIRNNGGQLIYSDRSTLNLLKRFTTENLDQRYNQLVIMDQANEVVKVIKDQPYLLDVLENISKHYLVACVNQPVMGFVKTAILTDFAVEQDISAKLNIAKRMAIIAAIEQEILSLKSQSGDVIGGGVQIELGNAMLREIYNQNKHIIEDQTGGAWKGISKGITYEGAIRGFLTEENIAKVWQKVDGTLKNLSDINKAREYVAEASLNGTHKDFAMILVGKEGFDERQKELKSLKAQYLEIEDSSSSSAVEIFNKIQIIEKGENLREKVDSKIRELLHESGADRGKRQKTEEAPGASPRESSISAYERGSR